MPDIFSRDCDKCLKPYWNDKNSDLCDDCNKKPSNKSGEDLVACKECGDYFYSFSGKLKLCFWCDTKLIEEE